MEDFNYQFIHCSSQRELILHDQDNAHIWVQLVNKYAYPCCLNGHGLYQYDLTSMMLDQNMGIMLDDERSTDPLVNSGATDNVIWPMVSYKDNLGCVVDEIQWSTMEGHKYTDVYYSSHHTTKNKLLRTKDFLQLLRNNQPTVVLLKDKYAHYHALVEYGSCHERWRGRRIVPTNQKDADDLIEHTRSEGGWNPRWCRT
jgi:hypothetical protein